MSLIDLDRLFDCKNDREEKLIEAWEVTCPKTGSKKQVVVVPCMKRSHENTAKILESKLRHTKPKFLFRREMGVDITTTPLTLQAS